MKLALIFPPGYHRIHEENSYGVTENFGHYPPLNLLYVAAIAEEAGHKVIVIDAHANNFSKEDVLKKINDFNADLIGVEIHSTFMFQQNIEWVNYLKEKTNKKILVGGFNLHLFPKETMTYDSIDFAVIGSAKYSLPKFLAVLENNKSYEEIEGICYRNGRKVVINYPNKLYYPLESLPFPARHLIDNRIYYSFVSQYKNFTIMFTSLGCPMRCNFCEEGKTPFIPRPAKNVVDEIEECYKKYNIREIDFFDVSFTHERERVVDICKGIIKRGIKIKWSCRSRIDNVDDELLKLMKKSGCDKIYYGIESGNQDILNKIRKGTTLKKIEETVKLTHKNKIKVLGYFMIGQPGETRETIEQTIKFAKKIKCDYVQFSKTLAKPTSELVGLLPVKYINYWAEYVLGRTKEIELPRPWTKLSNKEIDYYTKKAYLSFYLRPTYIIKALLRLKSFAEFRRGVKATFDMIANQG